MKLGEYIRFGIVAGVMGGTTGFIVSEVNKQPVPDYAQTIDDMKAKVQDLGDRVVMTNQRLNRTDGTIIFLLKGTQKK